MSGGHPTTEHVTTLASNDMGYYARCTCGWVGSTRDRRSCDSRQMRCMRP